MCVCVCVSVCVCACVCVCEIRMRYIAGINSLGTMWEEEFSWKDPTHPDCTIDCTTPARTEYGGSGKWVEPRGR